MTKKKSNTTPSTSSTPKTPSEAPAAAPAAKAAELKLVTPHARGTMSRAITLVPLKLPGSRPLYVRILRDVEHTPAAMLHHPERKWINPGGERFEIQIHPIRDNFYLTDLRGGLLVIKGDPNSPKTAAKSEE